MTILWMNLFIVFILAFFARYFAIPVTNSLILIKPNRMLVLMAALSLVLVAGLRNNIGDTYFYMHAYNVTEFNWEYIQNNKDMGFNIFQMILKGYTDDPQAMVFITALITNLLIVFTLYKYSRLIEISLYVYITSGMYLVSMNGIRQYLAAAISFAAIKYIFDGSWKKYVLIILLHQHFIKVRLF